MANPETPTTDNSTPVTPVNAPAQAAPTSTPDDIQARLDAVAANVRKEATAAARKALLKELGIENADDPDAVKTVKGKLTAAQQAEEAQKSAEEKALDRIAKLEKERDEFKNSLTAMQQKQLISNRNGEVTKALITAKVNANDADDLRILLEAKYSDMFESLMDESGKVSESGLKKLITKAQETYPKYFTNPAPGSPSNHDGRVPNVNKKPILNGSLKF